MIILEFYSRRIVGGNAASPKQFPFLAILVNSDPFCDGTIITKNWVLTAAHCTIGLSHLEIQVGKTTYSNGTMYRSFKIVSHNNFNSATLKNDIALVKILGEFLFNEFVQPIQLSDIGNGMVCTVVGWGSTEEENIPTTLRYLNIKIISSLNCYKYLRLAEETFFLGPQNVCGISTRGRGPCLGDSGGPLVHNNKIVGIVSYAVKNCGQGLPDVYTRVSAYYRWIQEVTYYE